MCLFASAHTETILEENTRECQQWWTSTGDNHRLPSLYLPHSSLSYRRDSRYKVSFVHLIIQASSNTCLDKDWTSSALHKSQCLLSTSVVQSPYPYRYINDFSSHTLLQKEECKWKFQKAKVTKVVAAAAKTAAKEIALGRRDRPPHTAGTCFLDSAGGFLISLF